MSALVRCASSPVAYLYIGTRLTLLIRTHDETSKTHQLQTPPLIALSKTRLYRRSTLKKGDEPNLVAALDIFLRSLWDSFDLQFMSHIILLVDLNDTPEFKCHVLRWLNAVIPLGSTLASLSYPLFVWTVADIVQSTKSEVENDGSGEPAVVMDLGHSMTRVVPILHGTPVQEMLFCTFGVGKLTTGVRSDGPAKSFCATLSLDFQRFIESYVDVAVYVDEMIKERGEVALQDDAFIAEVDGYRQEMREGKSHQELLRLERFIDGLENVILKIKQNSSKVGIGAALSTWIITGGGAHILALRRLLFYLLGKHLPESMMVWMQNN